MANVLAVILLFFSASVFAQPPTIVTPVTLNVGTATSNLPALLTPASALRTLAPIIPAVRVGVTVWSIAEGAKLLFPAENLPTPLGWDDPNTPPPTQPATATWGGYQATQHATPTQACISKHSNSGYSVSNTFVSATYQSTFNYIQTYACNVQPNAGGPLVAYQTVENSLVCPSGYIPSGPSNCIPTLPENTPWPTDSQPTYVPDGQGGWKNHPKDLDFFPNLPTIIQEGLDQFGNPFKQTISSTPEGGATIEQKIETVDPEGNTRVTTRTVTMSPNGQITKASSTTINNTTINETSTSAGSSLTFPAFCSWATVVCDFIDWFKTDTPPPEQPQLPVIDIELPDYQSGLGSGSCPTSVSTSFQGKSITFPFTDACWAASNVFKPIMLLIAGIAAVFIVTGARSI